MISLLKNVSDMKVFIRWKTLNVLEMLVFKNIYIKLYYNENCRTGYIKKWFKMYYTFFLETFYDPFTVLSMLNRLVCSYAPKQS